MIKRALLLIALMGGLLVVVLFNPVENPQPVENPRFVKVSLDGKSMSAWDGPWSCVLDTSTGLLWEVKSYAEDMHDLQCSFTWFNGRIGVDNGGNCFSQDGKADTQDLIDHSNAGARCGATQWRLPTEKELRTLLSEDPLPGDVLIARDYFPYTQRGSYWTSNAQVPLSGHFQHLGQGAISINFRSGISQNMPYRDAAFTRLVTKPGFGN